MMGQNSSGVRIHMLKDLIELKSLEQKRIERGTRDATAKHSVN